MGSRAEHLVAEGLARRQGQRFVFASDLLRTLRQRELAGVSAKLAAANGLPHHAIVEGESIAGVYRQRLNLASGRFAMLDDGLGFSLVTLVAVAGARTRQARLRRNVAGRRG